MTAVATNPVSSIQLTKHQGLGNDFLIAVEPPRQLTPIDAISWCDRHRGVGADGLIMLGERAAGGVRRMTLWNADGSVAEISGNGIRCVAQALARHSKSDGAQRFTIDTDAGRRRLDFTPTDDPNLSMVKVDMGAAGDGPGDHDGWEELGVSVKRQMSVDMGNPHLVALVDDLAAHDISAVGPAVEANYPDGLNVHLVEPDGPNRLRLSIWERGAGATQACGSGACAAAFAASQWEIVTNPVEVQMLGGAVTVDVEDAGVMLTGPAGFIAAIEVPDRG